MMAGIMQAARNRGVTGYGASVLADNPIAYWRLNETSGTAAADEVGAYGGTYSGTYTLGNAGPITGRNALGLSGAVGEMSASPQSAISAAANATIEGWMFRAASGVPVFFGFGNAANRTFGILWFTDNRIYLYAQNGSGSFASFAANFTGWHHVAVTFDGSQTGWAKIKAYLNGVEQTLTTSGTLPTTIATSANLGNISAGTLASVPVRSNGRIAELAVYATTISGTRIAAHYDARTNP